MSTTGRADGCRFAAAAACVIAALVGGIGWAGDLPRGIGTPLAMVGLGMVTWFGGRAQALRAARAEAAAAAARLAALEVERARRLAHDVRNPLAIVTTNLAWVAAELEAGAALPHDATLHEALGDAIDAAGRVGAVVSGSVRELPQA